MSPAPPLCIREYVLSEYGAVSGAITRNGISDFNISLLYKLVQYQYPEFSYVL